MTARWPQTDQEWDEALRAAVYWLAFESARLYGLLSGGPKVNVERCEAVIAEGRLRGHRVPSVEEVTSS